MCIQLIQTSVEAKFVASGSCHIVGKFCTRQPYSPVVLPIVAVDTKVLLDCLDYSFM